MTISLGKKINTKTSRAIVLLVLLGTAAVFVDSYRTKEYEASTSALEALGKAPGH